MDQAIKSAFEAFELSCRDHVDTNAIADLQRQIHTAEKSIADWQVELDRCEAIQQRLHERRPMQDQIAKTRAELTRIQSQVRVSAEVLDDLKDGKMTDMVVEKAKRDADNLLLIAAHIAAHK